MEPKAKPVSFYNLKAIVDGILKTLNITDFYRRCTCSNGLAYGLQYLRGKQVLVNLAVGAAALKKVDVDKEVFYADFNFDLILQLVRKNKIVYQEVSKFPAVRRDLSMLVDNRVTFGQLKQIAVRTDKKLLKEVNVFDVYQGDKLPAGKKSYALALFCKTPKKL
jgi:phenylalanyl-tRNA synthetase beta chain